jgi:hypothetical protein
MIELVNPIYLISYILHPLLIPTRGVNFVLPREIYAWRNHYDPDRATCCICVSSVRKAMAKQQRARAPCRRDRRPARDLIIRNVTGWWGERWNSRRQGDTVRRHRVCATCGDSPAPGRWWFFFSCALAGIVAEIIWFGHMGRRKPACNPPKFNCIFRAIC